MIGRIPDHELQVSFARSGGAGGQNVNKTSTKVFVHWSVGKSRVFSLEQKDRIRAKLTTRLNNRDELVVSSEEERSQLANRARAVVRLQTLVANALKVPKKRTSTKPTYSSKLKRLESKKQRSKVKKTRRGAFDW